MDLNTFEGLPLVVEADEDEAAHFGTLEGAGWWW